MPGVSKKDNIINNLNIFNNNLNDTFSQFSKVISNNIYKCFKNIKNLKDIKKISIDYSILEEYYILSEILGYINSKETIFRLSEFSKEINIFDLEFQEAINYLTSKSLIDINTIDEITSDVRNNFKWIKKSSDLEVTKKIFNQLEKHMENGGTFKTFKDDIKDYLNKSGLGDTGYYLQNVYRTNLISAYNAGAYKQQIEVMETHPYWMYDSVVDEGTTATCRRLDGLIYRADDPIWDSIYPPNHYGCRGAVIPLGLEDMKENNYKVSKEKIDIDLKNFEGNPGKYYFDNLKNNILKKEKEVEFLSKKLEITENAKPYMEMFDINRFKPSLERDLTTRINRKLGNNSTVSHKSMQSYGTTGFSYDGKVVSINFKTGDKRTIESKIKTMYHELFHASANNYKNLVYHELEETMAETIGTYLAEINGANYKNISNSYIEILADAIPKLKTIEEFRDVKKVSEVGRIFLELGRDKSLDLLKKNNILIKKEKNKGLVEYILKYDIEILKNKEIKNNYIKFISTDSNSSEAIKKYYEERFDKAIEKIEKKDYTIDGIDTLYIINALMKEVL